MHLGNIESPTREAVGTVGILLSSEAERMIGNALEYCNAKTAHRGPEQIREALRAENSMVHDYFRHSLACQIAEYLAQLDPCVVQIYTHNYGDAEEEGEDRKCGITSNINLIIHVRRKTAALSSIIWSLDQALLERYRQLIAPKGERMASLLDVQMVDDREVEESIGLGAVLRSVYVRPVRVWPR